MKKAYVKPSMESEMFLPAEYIAACGDVNVTWSINCNVPTGFGFIDNNGNGHYDRGDTKLTSDGVYGCHVWHEGVTLPEGQKPEANAMWQPQRYEGGFWGGHYENDGDAFSVFYWSDGYGQTHRHFSIASEGDWHKENHS